MNKESRVGVWYGPKHRDHDATMKEMDRAHQVWEDDDGWTYFVLGPPVVVTYDGEGRPTYFNHPTLTVDHHGEVVDWPFDEHIDRKLEHNERFKRLA